MRNVRISLLMQCIPTLHSEVPADVIIGDNPVQDQLWDDAKAHLVLPPGQAPYRTGPDNHETRVRDRSVLLIKPECHDFSINEEI